MQEGCIPSRENVLSIVQHRLYEHYFSLLVVSPCKAQLPMVNCAVKYLMESIIIYHHLADSALKPTVTVPYCLCSSNLYFTQ